MCVRARVQVVEALVEALDYRPGDAETARELVGTVRWLAMLLSPNLARAWSRPLPPLPTHERGAGPSVRLRACVYGRDARDWRDGRDAGMDGANRNRNESRGENSSSGRHGRVGIRGCGDERRRLLGHVHRGLVHSHRERAPWPQFTGAVGGPNCLKGVPPDSHHGLGARLLTMRVSSQWPCARRVPGHTARHGQSKDF